MFAVRLATASPLQKCEETDQQPQGRPRPPGKPKFIHPDECQPLKYDATPSPKRLPCPASPISLDTELSPSGGMHHNSLPVFPGAEIHPGICKKECGPCLRASIHLLQRADKNRCKNVPATCAFSMHRQISSPSFPAH